MCYTTHVVPKPVASPTNKLWTIIPDALLMAKFLHSLYGCPYIPGIGSKNVFLGTFRTVTIMRRFRRSQPVQMHHPHLRRPMSPGQSAYHHPLMHLTTGGYPIRSEESDEAHHICRDPLKLLLRHGYLSVCFYKNFSGCCDMAKVLCILCTGSVVHIHKTLHEHIRTTSSCKLLFVLRTYMAMLLDSVIQHGIDGAHCQWCTPPYTMGDYHQVLIKSPSTVTM